MSVNGKVIPRTPLAVDFWYVRKCPETRLFFLSHMHSDHTQGLTSTWSHRPIYCSPTTATLLRLRLKVKEQWIHPLELDEPYMLPLDDIGKETMTVTLIDANHCPGSVMFLFQGYFGSILYTGDFRYTPSMLREPCLRTNITIDVLYLDNTNCDPNRTIPTRQRATQQIKEIIRGHPTHCVVIGLYALGKETLLVDLAMEFKTWIEVSEGRMETLKALGLPNVFTTEPGAGRIRVVEQSEIRAARFHQWNTEEPTLAILPTSRPLVSFHPNIYVVPYSDHSSYQELEDFVSALQPTAVVPIVGNHIPGSLSALVPTKKRRAVSVPESVQQYMLRESGSSTCTHQARIRHIDPVTPRGVIFESPAKESVSSCEEASKAASMVSDEEMDTESNETVSTCILIDQSMDLVPESRRQQAGDTWNLSIVKTVSAIVEESVPLGELTQSNFIPAQVVTNADAGFKPPGNTRHFQTDVNPAIKDTTVYHRSRQSRRGNAQNDPSLSGGDGTSQQSGCRIDGDDDIVSNDNNISQHNGRHRNNRGAANESWNSERSLRVLRQEYVEEIENSILNDLPFAEEDLKPCSFLQLHLVQRVSP
eukprot:XP_011620239.1 PREDICTED: 5' exonuclease Apollo isoform X1 [Takifugu rubripes]